jgi:RNA polymerase sigma-70 factor (ECF subfamily)
MLMAGLQYLPLSRRAVIVMHDLDEVPIADVARSLSITRFGAYARLRKGRRELAAAVRRLSRGEARI